LQHEICQYYHATADANPENNINIGSNSHFEENIYCSLIKIEKIKIYGVSGIYGKERNEKFAFQK
jgi:hypothetical protein